MCYRLGGDNLSDVSANYRLRADRTGHDDSPHGQLRKPVVIKLIKRPYRGERKCRQAGNPEPQTRNTPSLPHSLTLTLSPSPPLTLPPSHPLTLSPSHSLTSRGGRKRRQVGCPLQGCRPLWSVPYTPHPTPYTLHPPPYTLLPTPYSVHPTP